MFQWKKKKRKASYKKSNVDLKFYNSIIEQNHISFSISFPIKKGFCFFFFFALFFRGNMLWSAKNLPGGRGTWLHPPTEEISCEGRQRCFSQGIARNWMGSKVNHWSEIVWKELRHPSEDMSSSWSCFPLFCFKKNFACARYMIESTIFTC